MNESDGAQSGSHSQTQRCFQKRFRTQSCFQKWSDHLTPTVFGNTFCIHSNRFWKQLFGTPSSMNMLLYVQRCSQTWSSKNKMCFQKRMLSSPEVFPKNRIFKTRKCFPKPAPKPAPKPDPKPDQKFSKT